MKIKKIKTLDDLIANLQELQEIHGNLPLQREVELRCVLECEIKKPIVHSWEGINELEFYSKLYTGKTIAGLEKATGNLDRRIQEEKKQSLKSAVGEQDYNELDKADLEGFEKCFKDIKKQNIKNLQKPRRCLKIKKTITTVN